jgi:HAD superfamily hydrolase (TIGR01509 family)
MKDIFQLISSKRLLIFDFDGTLADTTPYHSQAFQLALDPFKLSYDYNLVSGMSTQDAIKKILQISHLTLHPNQIEDIVTMKQEIARNLIAQNLQLDSDVSFFLEWADDHYQFQLCIVSSGSSATIKAALKKLEIESYFDFLITADDVESAKPSPEGFLKALALGGSTNKEAIVFEDSAAGFQSALNANIPFVEVTQNFWKDINKFI